MLPVRNGLCQNDALEERLDDGIDEDDARVLDAAVRLHGLGHPRGLRPSLIVKWVVSPSLPVSTKDHGLTAESYRETFAQARCL